MSFQSRSKHRIRRFKSDLIRIGMQLPLKPHWIRSQQLNAKQLPLKFKWNQFKLKRDQTKKKREMMADMAVDNRVEMSCYWSLTWFKLDWFISLDLILMAVAFLAEMSLDFRWINDTNLGLICFSVGVLRVHRRISAFVCFDHFLSSSFPPLFLLFPPFSSCPPVGVSVSFSLVSSFLFGFVSCFVWFCFVCLFLLLFLLLLVDVVSCVSRFRWRFPFLVPFLLFLWVVAVVDVAAVVDVVDVVSSLVLLSFAFRFSEQFQSSFRAVSEQFQSDSEGN